MDDNWLEEDFDQLKLDQKTPNITLDYKFTDQREVSISLEEYRHLVLVRGRLSAIEAEIYRLKEELKDADDAKFEKFVEIKVLERGMAARDEQLSKLWGLKWNDEEKKFIQIGKEKKE